MPEFTQEEFSAADGHAIVGRFFEPRQALKGKVLIAPAFGTSQNYYTPFAGWLASRGFLTVTFDYRGTGLSRRGSLRGFKADILDWAKLDCVVVLDALAGRWPDKPIFWVGHSLGGQILPFVPNRRHVSRMITIATGSGYWRENAPPLRRVVWWLWYVLVPFTVRLFGYFPGRRLRKVGDLPRGVIEQWRRWCLHPDYAVGAEGDDARRLYEAVSTPIVSLSFTDDEYMSARNIESIHLLYTNAPLKMKRISPRVAGARIGHFGFFRQAFARTLWAAHLLPELSLPPTTSEGAPTSAKGGGDIHLRHHELNDGRSSIGILSR